MNKITIALDPQDWVWLCEFLSQVLKEDDMDEYDREDTERLLRLLQAAESGS